MYSKIDQLLHIFHSIPLPFEFIDLPIEVNNEGEPIKIRTFFAHRVSSDVTKDVLVSSGFKEVDTPTKANVIIGSRYNIETLREAKDWQKFAHFYATHMIGSKDEFHLRMKELKGRLGHDVPFYPLAYHPPKEYKELAEKWKSIPVWIIKAPALSRARHIRLAKSSEESPPKTPFIVEEYIARPFLITGRKFDIRIYALVTSINPLKIYCHRQGLALFATKPYQEGEDIKDLTMHITNYEINKDSNQFVQCEGLDEKIENSKWSLPFLWKYLESTGIDVKLLQQNVEYVATSAIIAGMTGMRRLHSAVSDFRDTNYELLGVDILLDENLKPYILEINVSPGMLGSSELDIYIKNEVIFDLYHIIKLIDCESTDANPCPGITFINQKFKESKTEERVNGVLNGTIKPWDFPVFADYIIIRDFLIEQKRKGGYHCAYPKRRNAELFKACFETMTYEDIVLRDWTKMNFQDRFDALLSNLDFHQHEMNPELGELNYPNNDHNNDCCVM